MTQGEIPVPERLPGAPGSAECARARATVVELIAARRSLAERPELRRHLLACADCNAIYRERLLADARWRRTLARVEQDTDEGEDEGRDDGAPRRPVLSPVAVVRAGFGGKGRGKVVLVVVLAIVFYAAVRLTPDPSGTARAELTVQSGRVASVGEPQGPGEPMRQLQRGDWVRTAEGSSALLALGQTVVEVASSTVVQVEEPSTRRLRLESGVLDTRGPLTITSRFGLVEVEQGAAHVTLDSRGVTVEVREGQARVLDSRGEQRLSSGRTGVLGFAR
jgi:hypothetical protein